MGGFGKSQQEKLASRPCYMYMSLSIFAGRRVTGGYGSYAVRVPKQTEKHFMQAFEGSLDQVPRAVESVDSILALLGSTCTPQYVSHYHFATRFELSVSSIKERQVVQLLQHLISA